MREPELLEWYFDSFKRLAAINLLALVPAALLASDAQGNAFALLLPVLFFASLVFSVNGVNRAMGYIASPWPWDARALRRKRRASSATLVVGVAGLIAYALYVFWLSG